MSSGLLESQYQGFAEAAEPGNVGDKYIDFVYDKLQRHQQQAVYVRSKTLIHTRTGMELTQHVLATQTVTKAEFRSSQTHEFEATPRQYVF